MKYFMIFWCFSLILIGMSARASDTSLSIHGFVAQGLAQAHKSNYINDSGDTSAALTDVGLNGSYVINDNLRLSGQVVYIDGGNRYESGFRVDYALLDWSVYHTANWQINTYIGRFKNYHWLYSSTRDVPMTRPSIILPQSVYFDATRDMSIGGDGVNLAIKYNHQSVGEFDFNISTGKSPISEEQTEIIVGDMSTGDLTHDNDLQTSFYWRPNLSQWRFGIALTKADFGYKKGYEDVYLNGILSLKRFYANAHYQAQDWSFSVELLQEKTTLEGLFFSEYRTSRIGQGGFVQFEYDLMKDLQVMTRYENFYNNKDDKNGAKLERTTGVPSYFSYQNDATLGFTYHVSSNTQIQLEHHWMKGTARLTPIVIPNIAANNHKYWQLWAIQLMYWF